MVVYFCKMYREEFLCAGGETTQKSTERIIAMMKKLLLGGMLSAALFATVSGAEAPQLTPEQQKDLEEMAAMATDPEMAELFGN